MKRNNFTLTEIVVALGIFSIIIMVLMQFFVTSQRAWTDSEKRSRAYADSRVLFELMESSLKSSDIHNFTFPELYKIEFYGASPFRVEKQDTPIEQEQDRVQKICFDGAGSDIRITIGSRPFDIILSNVISFNITRYDNEWVKLSGTTVVDRPPLIHVRIEMFANKADMDTYNDLSGTAKSDFFNKNGFTFTRTFVSP